MPTGAARHCHFPFGPRGSTVSGRQSGTHAPDPTQKSSRCQLHVRFDQAGVLPPLLVEGPERVEERHAALVEHATG